MLEVWTYDSDFADRFCAVLVIMLSCAISGLLSCKLDEAAAVFEVAELLVVIEPWWPQSKI